MTNDTEECARLIEKREFLALGILVGQIVRERDEARARLDQLGNSYFIKQEGRIANLERALAAACGIAGLTTDEAMGGDE